MDRSEDLEIRSERLIATVSPQGAELRSLALADGADLQWGGDPAVWKGRAPILFPVIGFVNHDRYRLGSRTFAMTKHGFARDRAFTVVEHDPGRLRLRLADDAASREVYPFAFRLDLVFALEEAGLSVTAEIANTGAEPLPASFGFHPALRWPLPFGQPRADHAIQFETEEPGRLRRIDTNGLLRPKALASPIAGRRLALRDELFTDDALIFDQVRSRAVVYGAEAGPKIRVAFPDFPILGVWTKPGAGFICIEPWAGLPDPEGYDGDFRDKPGAFLVEPGEVRRLGMSIGFQDG